jgi:hypothetical protein
LLTPKEEDFAQILILLELFLKARNLVVQCSILLIFACVPKFPRARQFPFGYLQQGLRSTLVLLPLGLGLVDCGASEKEGAGCCSDSTPL